MEFNDNELTNCTEDNFNEANIENVRKMNDESEFDNVVVMKINEKGTGKDPIVSDESRKILVKNLLK